MTRPATRAALALALACGAAPGCAREAPAPSRGREVVFAGMCDASAAVPLSERLFAVADDETNALRIYDADRGGEALAALDLSAGLDLPQRAAKAPKQKPPKAKAPKVKAPKDPPPAPEVDLEAATRIGDHAFWLSSHARSASGKDRPERRRFFATGLPREGAALEWVGRPYDSLLADLLADPRYAVFGLAQASERAPKDAGGLNIEGMTERPEGGVWIGFRNPVPEGRALLVPLLDPEQVVAGGRPHFGDPVRLDLGGLGVRALSRWRGRTLIVAGHTDGGGPSSLYTWDGHEAPRPVNALDFRGFNPEAFFAPEERDEILLLSDDGVRRLKGTECKRLKDVAEKRFRGRWVALGEGLR